jgi:hypothetical protein
MNLPEIVVTKAMLSYGPILQRAGNITKDRECITHTVSKHVNIKKYKTIIILSLV